MMIEYMSPTISLSTCWLSHRHEDGYEMLKEIADLGFEYAELSHGIRLSLVPGILRALNEGVIKISSVHNFCPLPVGVLQAAPNLFQPSSKSVGERDLWFRNTAKTLEFGKSVGARLMVAHMGSVSFFWSQPEVEVYQQLWKESIEILMDVESFKRKVSLLAEKAYKKGKKANSRVKACLEQILPIAKESGIKIAIENRDNILEIPLSGGHAAFLEDYKDELLIGGWHDTGHAKVREQLGLLDHEQHLKENADQLLGFHLKDVSASGRDDQPLGSGVIDFEMVANYFRPDHVLVLELGPRVSSEGVQESLDYLNALLEPREVLA